MMMTSPLTWTIPPPASLTLTAPRTWPAPGLHWMRHLVSVVTPGAGGRSGTVDRGPGAGWSTITPSVSRWGSWTYAKLLQQVIKETETEKSWGLGRVLVSSTIKYDIDNLINIIFPILKLLNFLLWFSQFCIFVVNLFPLPCIPCLFDWASWLLLAAVGI